jgi:hypothetical protein
MSKSKSKKITIIDNDTSDETEIIIDKIKKKTTTKKVNNIIVDNDTSDKDTSDKDKIWGHIFKSIDYDCENEKIITAEDIKKAGKEWKGKANQFEPRLLCKQDTDEERPDIFKKNNICILSIENGKYLLTKNTIYFNLEYPKVQHTTIKKNTDSLLLKLGNSESTLLDNLKYSGIFEKENYLNEKILFGPLLGGRHRCSFKTKLGDKDIEICGSQYETDACYESENKILLIECKSKSQLDSFNIRQIYYPYRSIYDLINGKKEIIPLIINKDKNDFIHIWKFKFDNSLEMSSIKKIDYRKYKLTD